MGRVDLSMFVDELLSQTDITEHIGQVVSLKKRGSTYWACCPFHEEKTASFHVDPKKGLYSCFGCHRGGNLLTFFMEYQKLNFIEAVKFLAEKEGRPMPGFMHERGEKNAHTREILEEALTYFTSKLETYPEVYSYLTSERRGLNPDTIREYRLGYAEPGWDGLLNHLRGKGFSIEDLIRQNLISKKSSAGEKSESFNDYYDRFRGRIIIPIFNHLGQLTGFAGRVFKEEDAQYGKYINTADDTPFGKTSYVKKNTLFGLDKAAQSIIDLGEAILTEGYFHHISSHQSGLLNVVASGGTAFTKEQATLLRRYADKILILMDPDAAGIRAARTAAEISYGLGFSPRLGLLPEGKDLDDISRECKNRDAILQRISFMDIPQFIIHTTQYDRSNPDDVHRTLEDLAKFFSLEKNAGRKLLWISETSKSLDVPKEIIHSYIRKDIREPEIDSDTIPDTLVKSYIYHLLTAPKDYRATFLSEIPCESRVFRFNKGLQILYKTIIEESRKNPQQNLDIEPPRLEELDFGVIRREQIFDYLRKKFMERTIEQFPFELQEFLYKKPKIDFKTTVSLLRHYVKEYQRQDLVQGLAEAYRTENEESIKRISEELRTLT